MGTSKGGDKNLEEAEGDRPVLVTRDELDQLSMDMQRKLVDFTHGQIKLSRQQAKATKEFNKRFDNSQRSSRPRTRHLGCKGMR
jgi:hypothetical protein